MYYFILFIANAVICFFGFFVNEFAIIQISGDSGGLWGGGTIDTILFGGVLFLIMSMIDITGNIKIYRHWNPNGSYRSFKFVIPIGAYVILDVLCPLYHIFIW